MKKMTCKQLGGACDMVFEGNSFQELAEKSKQHGVEMFQQKDEAHLAAMKVIEELMAEPGGMQKWFEGKQAEFDALQNV